MQIGLIAVFWLSLAGLLYTYLGYPLLVCLAATLHERRRAGRQPTVTRDADDQLPPITVLIAAHNAEHHIVDRITNILDADYPRERLSVIVASDGSTDGTAAAVERLGLVNVKVVAYHQRRGKITTLSDAIEQVTTEIVVFTDASNRFDRSSLRNLARHFADPNIGLVTGQPTMIDQQGHASESLYWRSEMAVRHAEAKLGIMLGASGSIYAVRRSLFVRPSRPVINDDLVLPMLVALKHGCQFRFDPKARAYVTNSGGLGCEFRRRCRIGAGALQCLPLLHDLVDPRHLKQAFAFASHKLLRWLSPFLLVAVLLCNVALAASETYRLMLGLQLVAYLLAMFGLIAPDRGLVGRLSRVASSFVFMNAALLVGFLRWASDPRAVIWNPTQRPAWNQLQTAKHS